MVTCLLLELYVYEQRNRLYNLSTSFPGGIRVLTSEKRSSWIRARFSSPPLPLSIPRSERKKGKNKMPQGTLEVLLVGAKGLENADFLCNFSPISSSALSLASNLHFSCRYMKNDVSIRLYCSHILFLIILVQEFYFLFWCWFHVSIALDLTLCLQRFEVFIWNLDFVLFIAVGLPCLHIGSE